MTACYVDRTRAWMTLEEARQACMSPSANKMIVGFTRNNEDVVDLNALLDEKGVVLYGP